MQYQIYTFSFDVHCIIQEAFNYGHFVSTQYYGTFHIKLDNDQQSNRQSNSEQSMLSRWSHRGPWMVTSKRSPNVQNYIINIAQVS